MPYTTPYLELMQAAIAKFGITAEDQGTKECLADWFLEQEIEGEPVSNTPSGSAAPVSARLRNLLRPVPSARRPIDRHAPVPRIRR